MRPLLLPEQVQADWARRYKRQHLAWWAGSGPTAWPESLPLGMPTAATAAVDPAQVRAWALAWQAWPGPGEVCWEERQWPRLGRQRLPAALMLATAEAAADLAGEGERWRRAVSRRRRLEEEPESPIQVPGGMRVYEALADWPDADIERLAALLRWVGAHRASGLYLRQLPVPGMDSKWIEQRRGVITDFAAALPWNRQLDHVGADEQGAGPVARDLHGLLGLVRGPVRLRLRVLCAELRRHVGGLVDIEAPRSELARIDWQPRRVLVVENLESALALPDLPGTVVFMKLGHAVSLLAGIPWLQRAAVRYWGDIDSHGLAILGRARLVIPHVESVLMDGDTLLVHRALWVQEPEPWAGSPPLALTAPERTLFDHLMAGTWGPRIRLEQERIPWAAVLAALGAAQPTPPQGAPASLPASLPAPVPQQLDIFADSNDVILRNTFADAVVAADFLASQAALAAWQAELPRDARLAQAAELLAQLQSTPAESGSSHLTAADVLAAAAALERNTAPAAAALLGSLSAAWMSKQWHRLATQAQAVPWQPAQAGAHAAGLLLRAGEWRAAAEAAASIESWRRIPQPLLWMAEARWRADGPDTAWPLLVEAFWLAPARARALLAVLADTRLRRAMTRFEEDFDAGEDDWAWWPAWLAVEQPLLARILELAEHHTERIAAEGFRVTASLLRLEREGRQHDIVATRRRLQALDARLFRCYMRTR
jgi:hypothetical protein